MSIGERVLYLLKMQGKTQKELAEATGAGKSTVGQWKEPNRNPSSELIVPICRFLGVSVNYLLTGEDSESGSLSQIDQDLLHWIHILNEETQRDFLGQIRLYVKQHKEDWATTDSENEDAPEKEEVAAASK